MENIKITEELLKKCGFIVDENFKFEDFSVWERWTNDVDDKHHTIKIDFAKGYTNNNADWNLHIDNRDCCTIGTADISYVWQFNKMMEIFESQFRLG